jgi:hypothetical protein
MAADVTVNVVSNIIYDCMDKEWKGSPDKRKEITERVESCEIFGFNERLRRSAYAKSPILGRLEDLNLSSGLVYVAHVPPGHGKTTACRAFLRASERMPKGIAFCPSRVEPPYARAMLLLLGLDTENPPDGWLTCLLDALNRDGEQSYLLLDDFMSTGPNASDESLIIGIKAAIRGTTITGIVLTQNIKSADYMLTLNGWAGIVPLIPFEDRLQIRTDATQNRTDPKMDWETDMYTPSIEWSEKALKLAAKVDPRHKKMEEGIRDSLIHNFLKSLPKDQRKVVNPLDVFDMLANDQHLPPHSDDFHIDTNFSQSTANFTTDGGCGGCHVM